MSSTAPLWPADAARDTERVVALLAERLRSGRVTVLYGVAGAGKTPMLMAGVMPLLRRRANDAVLHVSDDQALQLSPPAPLSFADRRARGASSARRDGEVAVYFDEWGEAAATRLSARLSEALTPARRHLASVGPGQSSPPWPSIRSVLADAAPLRCFLVLDRVEELLSAAAQRGAARELLHDLVQAINDPTLRLNVLLALRPTAATAVHRLRGRIRGFDAAAVHLPEPWQKRAPPSSSSPPATAVDAPGTTAPMPMPARPAVAPILAPTPVMRRVSVGDADVDEDTDAEARYAAQREAARVESVTLAPARTVPRGFLLPHAAPAAAHRPAWRRPEAAVAPILLAALLWWSWPNATPPAEPGSAAAPGAEVAAIPSSPPPVPPAPVVAAPPVAAAPAPVIVATAPPTPTQTPPRAELPTGPAVDELDRNIADDLVRVGLAVPGRNDPTRRVRADVVAPAPPAWPAGVMPLPGLPGYALARYDALQAARAAPAGPKLRVIAPLYTEPLYVLVRSGGGLRTLADLPGRRLNIGPAGSARAVTAAALAQRLSRAPLAPTPARALEADAALASLLGGHDVDAIVVVGDAGAAWLASLSPALAQRLKLLPLARDGDHTRRALQQFLPAKASLAGALGTSTGVLSTLSVMSFLVAADGPGAPTDTQAAAFAGALCRTLPALRNLGDPKWRSVQPGLQLPTGWPGIDAAQQAWRDCSPPPASRRGVTVARTAER